MTHDSQDVTLPDMISLMTGLIDDALYPLHEKISRSDNNVLPKKDYDKLVCYRTSAENGLDTLIEGSASINKLLFKSITNRDNPATQEDVLKTLSMLTSISQIIQSMLMARDDANYLLDESSKQSATADVVDFQELQSASA